MPRSRGSRARPKGDEPEQIVVTGREISISNPGKVLFPKPGHTKMDLVRYYQAVAEGAVRGAGGRPAGRCGLFHRRGRLCRRAPAGRPVFARCEGCVILPDRASRRSIPT